MVSPDSELLNVFQEALRRLSVDSITLQDPHEAANAIEFSDLDCIVIDWRLRHEAIALVSSVRESQHNSECLVAAIIGDSIDLQDAFAAGASFAINPPFTLDQVARCLCPVYGAIIRRRRYSIRHPLRVPVSIRSGSRTMDGRAIDLSMGGMALRPDAPLSVNEPITVTLALPGLECVPVTVTGHVRWVAPRGPAAGIQFNPLAPVQKFLFVSWLDRELESASLDARAVEVSTTRSMACAI